MESENKKTYYRDKFGKFTTKRKLEIEHKRVENILKKKVDGDDSSLRLLNLEGRRIIDLRLLAEKLWCTFCNDALSLRFLVKEEFLGLVSIFHVRCQKCQEVYKFATSKSYKIENDPNIRYSANGKIAIGLLASGMGVSQLNTILASLNVPTLYHTLFKRYEREVGVMIEKVAHDSCQKNLQIEKAMTLQKKRLDSASNEIVEDDEVGLILGLDGGWQKKASGRTYNSKTGHVTVIGHYSGLLVAFSTRSKRCIKCDKGHSKDDHDCRKNYDGSSKSMEADMAVETLINNPAFAAEKVRLDTLIADDDSSTIARLRRESSHLINKWIDKNHATTTLTKKLYELKLSKPYVDYFKYCFGCVLEKHRDDEKSTKEALLNIVPHAFDEHTKCGEWCGYHIDPINYKHKILPNGEGLKDHVLKKKLDRIFENFADNAAKLTPCASTQKNESLNMKIASKAPKTRHYGGSESNDFRVATAVCEQNVGFSFIDTINDKLKYSPLSKRSIKFLEKKDSIKKNRADLIKTQKFRNRRRELFKNNKNGNVNAERKEGVTYQSKCGFDVGVEFIDAPIHVQPISTDSTEIVFFDLETTGLGNNCEIVQIAARFKNLSFNVYILPLGEISPQAAEVTRMKVEDGQLFVHNKKVTTVSIKQAAENFINFLKSVHEKILLAAHNCSRFDAPHLLRLINKLKLFDVFKTVVIGFIDTLPVLKKKLLNRVKEKKKFKLTVLAEEYLGADIIKDAHNATCDVLILQQLMELKSINISTEDLKKQAVPLNFQAHKIAQQWKIKSLKPSLLCFLQNKDSAEAKKVCSGISITMINKIAEAGISKEQNLESFQKNRSQGISILLGQDVGGKPRVTKSSAMIKKLCTKISEIIKNNDTEFNKKDK